MAITYPQENIFGLTDPENYQCNVAMYRQSHSLLVLRVLKRSPWQVHIFQFGFAVAMSRVILKEPASPIG